jgi:hypothetical protein
MKNNLLLISLLVLLSTSAFAQNKKLTDKKSVATDTTKIVKKDSVIKKIEVIEEVEIMDLPVVETEEYEYETEEATEAVEMDDYEYYGDEMEATIEAPAEYYSEEAVEDVYMNTKFLYDTKLKPVDNPDKKPSYSLGNNEMFEYFATQANCPYNHGNNSGQIVIIEFTVGKDSKLYNPKTLSTPGANFTRNAENIIKQLPGTFNPGTKNGKPVDSVIRIPVRFDYKLSSNKYKYSTN